MAVVITIDDCHVYVDRKNYDRKSFNVHAKLRDLRDVSFSTCARLITGKFFWALSAVSTYFQNKFSAGFSLMVTFPVPGHLKTAKCL